MPVAERHESLTAAFDALRRDPAFGPDWLAGARQAAFDRFLDRGFPTTREEDWRFTSVAPVAKLAFSRAAEAAPARNALAAYLFDDLPTIVVVNGRVSNTLSTAGTLAGVTIETLRDAD